MDKVGHGLLPPSKFRRGNLKIIRTKIQTEDPVNQIIRIIKNTSTELTINRKTFLLYIQVKLKITQESTRPKKNAERKTTHIKQNNKNNLLMD